MAKHRNRTKLGFDKVAMVYATERSLGYLEDALERAKKATEDTEQEKRIAANECKYCFYMKGRIGGCAITEAFCALCGKSHSFGSTCVDRLCRPCASVNSMCCHCGGDLELRPRRKKWPEPLDESDATSNS